MSICGKFCASHFHKMRCFCLTRERNKQQHHLQVDAVDEHCQRRHHVAADLASFRCVGQILLLIYQRDLEQVSGIS